jgi:uncharacterized protein
MPFLALGTAGFTDRSTPGVADQVTEFVVVAFAQGKFYLLFSFLFGYSLTLLLHSRSADGLPRYRRRLLGLAVLGLAHATLFFIGDILMSYAVLGLVLLWFVPRSDRTALTGAALAYAAGLAVQLMVIALVVAEADAGGGTIVSGAAELDRALLGSFGDAALGRTAVLPEALAFQAVINWALRARDVPAGTGRRPTWAARPARGAPSAVAGAAAARRDGRAAVGPGVGERCS